MLTINVSSFVTLSNDLGPPNPVVFPSLHYLPPIFSPQPSHHSHKQALRNREQNATNWESCLPSVGHRCVLGKIFDPISEEEETKGQGEFPKHQMLSKRCLMLVHTCLELSSALLFPVTTRHVLQAKTRRAQGIPLKTFQRAEPPMASMGLIAVFSKTLLDRKACFSTHDDKCLIIFVRTQATLPICEWPPNILQISR